MIPSLSDARMRNDESANAFQTASHVARDMAINEKEN